MQNLSRLNYLPFWRCTMTYSFPSTVSARLIVWRYIRFYVHDIQPLTIKDRQTLYMYKDHYKKHITTQNVRSLHQMVLLWLIHVTGHRHIKIQPHQNSIKNTVYGHWIKMQKQNVTVRFYFYLSHALNICIQNLATLPQFSSFIYYIMAAMQIFMV
jgi:hypothetical protein